MKSYIITTETSIVDNSGTAFDNSVAGSTLTVKTNAYLVSTNGGNGAQVYNFSTVTVNGTIASYDEANNFDGLDAYAVLTSEALGSSPVLVNTLTLTVGATGNIYGYSNGVYTTQTTNISNSGTIQGGDQYAIQEYASRAGGDTLNNTTSGRIIGYYDGLYVSGNGYGVNQTVTNAGLIEGTTDCGLDLSGTATTKISNLATGQIVGEYGVYDASSTGAQSVTNAGLIDGYKDCGIEFYQAGGSTSVHNAASGRIVGDDGIYEESVTGSVKISNAGTIDGGYDYGVYVSGGAAPATVNNAATGQILGYDDGLYFDGYSGALSLTNAGLIWGEYDDGVYLAKMGDVAISNAATGAIKGEYDGIYETAAGTGSFSLANAGLIAGLGDCGVNEESGSGGSTITNAATGTIAGGDGIYDKSSASKRSIANAGQIVGYDDDAIVELTSGAFTLTNSAAAVINGYSSGIYDSAASGTRKIVNAGLVQGADGDGIYETTAGAATITNSAGGQIIGAGASASWGIYDSGTGTQTISNAGAIIGSSGAIYAEGGGAVIFTNSGVINGNVELTGDDNVTVTGGKVNGAIDMSLSKAVDKFTSSGGLISGQVLFGTGAGDVATLEAGALGINFSLGAGGVAFDYKSATASTGTTSATRDTINGWGSTDMINLIAFASQNTFTDIHQDFTTSVGNDIVTLKGSKFAVELMGVTSANALTAANFTF